MQRSTENVDNKPAVTTKLRSALRRSYYSRYNEYFSFNTQYTYMKPLISLIECSDFDPQTLLDDPDQIYSLNHSGDRRWTLLEGDVNVGKSTWMRHILEAWTQQLTGNHYEYMLYLDLSHLKTNSWYQSTAIKESRSEHFLLWSYIYYSCNLSNFQIYPVASYFVSGDLISKLINLEKKSPNSIFVMLDNYDDIEWNNHGRHHIDIVNKVLNSIRSLFSNVILATKSLHSMSDFKSNFSNIIHIHNERGVAEFYSHRFGDQFQLACFKNAIRFDSSIHSLCSFPMYINYICNEWGMALQQGAVDVQSVFVDIHKRIILILCQDGFRNIAVHGGVDEDEFHLLNRPVMIFLYHLAYQMTSEMNVEKISYEQMNMYLMQREQNSSNNYLTQINNNCNSKLPIHKILTHFGMKEYINYHEVNRDAEIGFRHKFMQNWFCAYYLYRALVSNDPMMSDRCIKIKSELSKYSHYDVSSTLNLEIIKFLSAQVAGGVDFTPDQYWRLMTWNNNDVFRVVGEKTIGMWLHVALKFQVKNCCPVWVGQYLDSRLMESLSIYADHIISAKHVSDNIIKSLLGQLNVEHQVDKIVAMVSQLSSLHIKSDQQRTEWKILLLNLSQSRELKVVESAIAAMRSVIDDKDIRTRIEEFLLGNNIYTVMCSIQYLDFLDQDVVHEFIMHIHYSQVWIIISVLNKLADDLNDSMLKHEGKMYFKKIIFGNRYRQSLLESHVSDRVLEYYFSHESDSIINDISGSLLNSTVLKALGRRLSFTFSDGHASNRSSFSTVVSLMQAPNDGLMVQQNINTGSLDQFIQLVIVTESYERFGDIDKKEKGEVLSLIKDVYLSDECRVSQIVNNNLPNCIVGHDLNVIQSYMSPVVYQHKTKRLLRSLVVLLDHGDDDVRQLAMQQLVDFDCTFNSVDKFREEINHMFSSSRNISGINQAIALGIKTLREKEQTYLAKNNPLPSFHNSKIYLDLSDIEKRNHLFKVLMVCIKESSGSYVKQIAAHHFLSVSQQLCEHMELVDDCMDAMMCCQESSYAEVKTIAAKIAENIIRYCSYGQVIDVIDYILGYYKKNNEVNYYSKFWEDVLARDVYLVIYILTKYSKLVSLTCSFDVVDHIQRFKINFIEEDNKVQLTDHEVIFDAVFVSLGSKNKHVQHQFIDLLLFLFPFTPSVMNPVWTSSQVKLLTDFNDKFTIYPNMSDLSEDLRNSRIAEHAEPLNMVNDMIEEFRWLMDDSVPIPNSMEGVELFEQESCRNVDIKLTLDSIFISDIKIFTDSAPYSAEGLFKRHHIFNLALKANDRFFTDLKYEAEASEMPVSIVNRLPLRHDRWRLNIMKSDHTGATYYVFETHILGYTLIEYVINNFRSFHVYKNSKLTNEFMMDIFGYYSNSSYVFWDTYIVSYLDISHEDKIQTVRNLMHHCTDSLSSLDLPSIVTASISYQALVLFDLGNVALGDIKLNVSNAFKINILIDRIEKLEGSVLTLREDQNILTLELQHINTAIASLKQNLADHMSIIDRMSTKLASQYENIQFKLGEYEASVKIIRDAQTEIDAIDPNMTGLQKELVYQLTALGMASLVVQNPIVTNSRHGHAGLGSMVFGYLSQLPTVGTAFGVVSEVLAQYNATQQGDMVRNCSNLMQSIPDIKSLSSRLAVMLSKVIYDDELLNKPHGYIHLDDSRVMLFQARDRFFHAIDPLCVNQPQGADVSDVQKATVLVRIVSNQIFNGYVSEDVLKRNLLEEKSSMLSMFAERVVGRVIAQLSRIVHESMKSLILQGRVNNLSTSIKHSGRMTHVVSMIRHKILWHSHHYPILSEIKNQSTNPSVLSIELADKLALHCGELGVIKDGVARVTSHYSKYESEIDKSVDLFVNSHGSR